MGRSGAGCACGTPLERATEPLHARRTVSRSIGAAAGVPARRYWAGLVRCGRNSGAVGAERRPREAVGADPVRCGRNSGAIAAEYAKRRYMPSVIAERLGVRGGFRVVTNVIVALWSSEVLHVVRRHRPSFSAICPHGPEQFAAWWSGQPPAVGVVSSSIILFDPVDGGRADRRRFVGLEEVPTVRPRYRGYADAVEALRRESQSTFHPE